VVPLRRDLRGHDATIDFDAAAQHVRTLNLGRRRKRAHLRDGCRRCLSVAAENPRHSCRRNRRWGADALGAMTVFAAPW
jgi:hypothetical protein